MTIVNEFIKIAKASSNISFGYNDRIKLSNKKQNN